MLFAGSSCWWHGRSSHVFYDDDDFYDEPLFFETHSCGGTKPKRYSDRYQFSCEQEDYCAETNGAGKLLLSQPFCLKVFTTFSSDQEIPFEKTGLPGVVNS